MSGKVIFHKSFNSLLLKLKNFDHGHSVAAWEEVPSFGESLGEVQINALEEVKSAINSELLKPNLSNIAAYDESILELKTLEGILRCTTHCCIIQDELRYYPSGFVSLKYYTSSELVSNKIDNSNEVILTHDIAYSITKEYIDERREFLVSQSPDNSLLFIDGSMFSGQSTSGNFVLVDELQKKRTFPVFFVKNSDSTIIRDNYEAASLFHNDLHWAHATLKQGERSQLFQYQSKEGRSKVMCFLKIFESRSPVRIEFPYQLFKQGAYPENIFEIIYYQFLANGYGSNIQPKIIQVAELYAREILKSTNLYSEIEKLGLTNSMNEERF